jgi:hypothetical protein
VVLDPEVFRKKVGSYSDRWYIDPLPSCPIAPHASAWQAPSVSTIKKAAGKDWSPVTIRRIAGWVVDNRPDWSGEVEFERVRSQMASASDDALGLASERGTQIHTMFEEYGNGGDPASVELDAAAQNYRTTTLRAIGELQPKVALAEAVALSRSLGYGGTFDAVWWVGADSPLHQWVPDLQVGFYMVDYKSRAKNHDVYLEEAWQAGAYGRADYWVIEGDDGQPTRIEPLELVGGLILSITPSSYRVYPIDLDLAFAGFQELLALWKRRAAGKPQSGIGQPWPDRPYTRDEWVRLRIATIKDLGGIPQLLAVWPEGVTRPKLQVEPYSDDDIDALLVPLNNAEREVGAPWPPNDPGRSTAAVVEGDEWDQDKVWAVRYRFERLASVSQEYITSLVRQADEAGVPFGHLRTNPTARRISIYRALILAVEHKLDEKALRAIIGHTTGTSSDKVPLAVTLGRLTADQAQVVQQMVSMAHHEQPKIVDETPTENLEGLTKNALQDICRRAGLPVSGNKAELVERIVAYRDLQ